MERDPDLGFDLAAASLRADDAEVARAVEIFATKLEDALPASCRVARRRRGLLSRESKVAAVEVDLGDVTFTLQQTRHGIVAERARRVHDMSRRSEKLQLAHWLRSL